MPRKRIDYTDLPVSAWQKISKRQQGYIDEFEFFQVEHKIEAHYAGEKLATWDGMGWR